MHGLLNYSDTLPYSSPAPPVGGLEVMNSIPGVEVIMQQYINHSQWSSRWYFIGEEM